MAFKVNFKLKPVDEIQESLSLFTLTDGVYNYDINGEKMLCYKNPEYVNDYYLERFADDFLSIAEFISVSVSDRLYRFIKTDHEKFEKASEKFCEKYMDAIDGTSEVMGKDEKAVKHWVKILDTAGDISDFINCQRMIDHGHLIDRLNIWFFRCREKLLIRWESSPEFTSAEVGQTEISWHDFVDDIKEFFGNFINQMQERIYLVLDNEKYSSQIDGDLSKQLDNLKKRVSQVISFMESDHDIFDYLDDKLINTAVLCNDVIKMKYAVEYYCYTGLEDRLNDIHENAYNELERIDEFTYYEGIRILREIISQGCQASNDFYITEGRKLARRLPTEWVERNLRSALFGAFYYSDENDRNENICDDVDRLTEMFCMTDRMILAIMDFCRYEKLDKFEDKPMVLEDDFDRQLLYKKIKEYLEKG